MRTVIALGVVYMTLLIAPPTFSMVSGKARGTGPILVTDTPLYLADEATRRNLAGNFAAPMDWSDYLVWKTEGKLRPLVYSHVHLADSAAWDDYVTIFRGNEAWLDLCRRRELRYLIVNKQVHRELMTRVLLADRSGSKNVRVLYQDRKSLLAEIH
jgi:hypothetical protein